MAGLAYKTDGFWFEKPGSLEPWNWHTKLLTNQSLPLRGKKRGLQNYVLMPLRGNERCCINLQASNEPGFSNQPFATNYRVAK